MTEFEKKVYELVSQVPEGMVTTYGDIARALGNRRMCRAVGNALHKNPYDGIVPCHRVVNSQGRLSDAFVFGGHHEQKARLEREHVEVVDLHVDLEVYRYIF